MNNVDETLRQRGSRYGSYSDVSALTVELFGPVWRKMQGREEFKHYHVEALHMICNKMALAVCGDPMYADNWHDIAGYAKLVENKIEAAKV